jgi:AraC-like DNA-binding protein
MLPDQMGHSANGGMCLPLKPYDLQCITEVHKLLTKDPISHVTIEGIAMEVGINRNKLHYGFKQVYGLTIHQYQEHLRMEKARHLLATTFKPIKHIAHATGYCNSSRLGAVYKKTYGVTPYQYRKQVQAAARRNAQLNNERPRNN